MSHFNDIELHRWSASGPGGDRERVVAHLAECADCSRRYAAAIRSRPLQAEPVADAEDFARVGRRASGLRRNRRRLLSLAAAAVLVLVVAIPLALNRHEPMGELHLRGGGVQALAPAGAVDEKDLAFIYASGLSPARYRVVVGDSTRVIFTGESGSTRFATPAALRDQLKPGIDYWWTVTALDAAGNPIATSARTTFKIR